MLKKIFSKVNHPFFSKGQYKIGVGSKVFSSGRIVNMREDKSAISIGNASQVLGELLVFAHGGNICIGDECSIGIGTRIWSGESIIIGNRVLISHGVNIFDNQTHPLSASERSEHFRKIVTSGHPSEIELGERPIVIEDDVWIACMSIILRGVHIGRGVVVGAGSVVTKDVPAWSVVAGNPARVIKTVSENER
jgi:acetyltransferase-like isoleucine patch superfamily enzyme